jgi:hypothetical protein
VDQPAEEVDPLDRSPRINLSGNGYRHLEADSAVRPVAVVVPDVDVQHVPELALAEDQHPVGELDSGGQYEPLGVGVRLRRRLHPVGMIAVGGCG